MNGPWRSQWPASWYGRLASPGLVGFLVVGLVLSLLAGPVFAAPGANTGPTFDVRIESTNSPVSEGESLDVVATVRNTGDEADTQTVTLSTGDVVRDRETVELAPDERTSITLSWETTEGDAGSQTVRIASDADADRTDILVRSGEVFEVDSCTVIDEPGLYVLQDSIKNSNIDPCIRIAASHVVLEGEGATIDGVDTDTDTVGIELDTRTPLEHVVIRNLTVTGWVTGLQAGTTYTNDVTDSTIQDVAAIDNGNSGIALFRTHGTRILEPTLVNNTNGIVLAESSNITVHNATIRRHTNATVFSGASHNTFRTVTIRETDGWAAVASPAEATGNSVNNTFERADFGFPNVTTTVRLQGAGVRTLERAAVASPPPDRTDMGVYFATTMTDPDGYIDLTVRYTDASVADVDESSLEWWRYDETWSAVGGIVDSSVETNANTVTATVRFVDSTIALFAEGQKGPKEDSTATTGTRASSVSFTYYPETPKFFPETLASVHVSEPVTFYASEVASQRANIERYEWRIDGAVVSTEKQVEHAFKTDGIHQVTLTVTDTLGTSTSTSVNVSVARTTPTRTATPTPGQAMPGSGFGVVLGVIALLAIGLLGRRLP